MTTSRLLASLRNAVRRFGADTRGNTMLTFVFAFVPMIGLIGAAIDYTRASSIKTAMQAAVDITALKLAQNASTNQNLSADANTYFRALLQNPLAGGSHAGQATVNVAALNPSATATYSTTNGGTVVVRGTATYMPIVISVLNRLPASLAGNGATIGPITLHANSTANWSTARLRVALVLDNTGSMSQGTPTKLQALKDALTSQSTTNPGLLKQLQTAGTNPGDVYVSIVPFVKDVNVGASNFGQSWIYWDDAAHTDTKSWDALNGRCSTGARTRDTCGSCSDSSITSQSTCTASGTCSMAGYTDQSSCQAAGTCNISGYTSASTCNAAAVCSNPIFTTQSTCTAGSCSISGYTTQNTCQAAGTCNLSGHTTKNSCQSAGVCTNPGQLTQSACTGTRACSNSSYASKTACQNAGYRWGFGTWTSGVWTAGVWTPPGTWTTGHWTSGTWTPATWSAANWTPSNHNTWNGCVADRGDSAGPNANNYDQNVVAPNTSIPATLLPAEQYSACTATHSTAALATAVGLNYNWTTMNSLVNSMVANGSTNQAIGLQLGWMSLTGGGPFTAVPMDSNYQYQQYIILLTDGLNTQDRWYGNGSDPASQVDTRQQTLCDNIKSAGITIYTIQADTDGEPRSDVLQYCAGTQPFVGDDGSNGYYTLLTDPNDIKTVFSAIGQKISKLHIAQ
jgi:Flp pilus assembly protein TadG